MGRRRWRAAVRWYSRRCSALRGAVPAVRADWPAALRANGRDARAARPAQPAAAARRAFRSAAAPPAAVPAAPNMQPAAAAPKRPLAAASITAEYISMHSPSLKIYQIYILKNVILALFRKVCFSLRHGQSVYHLLYVSCEEALQVVSFFISDSVKVRSSRFFFCLKRQAVIINL